MKMRNLLFIALAVVPLTSCGVESKASDEYVANLTNSIMAKYLTYSFSYSEETLYDSKVKFSVTAIFLNIDEKYYYLNFKIKFKGESTAYTIPQNGMATLMYSTLSPKNPSEAVLTMLRSNLGAYDIQSGSVYLKAQ